MRLTTLSLLAGCLLAAAVAGGARTGGPDPRAEVLAHERAFAASMAARDFDAFGELLADEAVFLSAQGALRGKAAVLAGWRPYYDGAQAPFSWAPERVEVVESGTLALSSGPIRDAAGRRIGSHEAVWRLEAPGRWRIVFDRGCACRDEARRAR